MIQELSPKQAQELMARGEVEVVDVREPHEWSAGHIAGASHVPLARFRADPKGSLARDGAIFVCAAGVRSQTAARLAQSPGIETVYNLSGGTRAWVNAGLPLVREATAA